jgi:glycosyltransferase involved in cell wall biosynthesis
MGSKVFNKSNLKVAIVSQDDISVKANPCGSKSYVINLLNHFYEINAEITYIGTISKQTLLRKKIRKLYSISKEEISTSKFIIFLLIKLFFIRLTTITIIHAQKPLEMLPFVFLKNKKILTLHGQELKRVRFKKSELFLFFYIFFERLVLKKTDKIIAVDKITKKYYLNEYPWLKGKIHVIPIGIDTYQFRPRDISRIDEKYINTKTNFTISFVGRLEPEKNLKFLFNSFKIIQSKVEAVKLLIIGKGSCENELKDYATDNSIRNIYFQGEIPNDIIPDLLSYSDVFVLCSLYEGSPTVIKEALACNTSVVSLDVGDVAEVISEIEGSFITKRNIQDFSDRIIEVLLRDEHFDSREKMLQFNHEEIGKKTVSLYTST